jgi:hypothetical protein
VIGYRIIYKYTIKYYKEDGTTKICVIKGNKRIKPDRIWKFGHRYYGSRKISMKRMEELKDKIIWFEES